MRKTEEAPPEAVGLPRCNYMTSRKLAISGRRAGCTRSIFPLFSLEGYE